MVHLTVAIADFMWILVSTALWSSASIAGGVMGAAAAGYGARRLWRGRRGRRG